MSVIFGAILVLLGILAVGHFGQTNAACGAPSAGVNVNPRGNCTFVAYGFGFAVAALAVGCVLFVGAFILTLSIPTER